MTATPNVPASTGKQMSEKTSMLHLVTTAMLSTPQDPAISTATSEIKKQSTSTLAISTTGKMTTIQPVHTSVPVTMTEEYTEGMTITIVSFYNK